MIDKNRYISFCKAIMKVVETSNLPKYTSKYSPKKYTVVQHITLLALKEYENKSYRHFKEWLMVTDKIVDFLDLPDIPHFTTLNKFMNRVNTNVVQTIIGLFSNDEIVNLAIDSTGMRLEHGSYYYTKRLKQLGVERTQTNKHLKLSIGVETDSQFIVSSKLRRGPASDHIDFDLLLKKASSWSDLKTVIADKGYDSEQNHKIAREEFNSESIISPRNQDVPVHRTKGWYRKKMKRDFDKEKYNQRNKVETVNSVIKRVMDDSIKSRNVKTQNREMEFKMLAYNAHRQAMSMCS
ncbi:MAG: IS5 family transposase [Candidatus Thermoplasmatota archaeon]|nr:IS5 family transposase [Candidatus Thermoplasmatota archaeon]